MELKNHIDIYPNGVFIDGEPITVERGGLSINDYESAESLTTVTLTVLPKSVTVHTTLHEGKAAEDRDMEAERLHAHIERLQFAKG